MTLYDLFWGLGELLETVLSPLDADWGLTGIMNKAVILLGFVGLFYWLNWQRKFNAKAASDPNQRK